MTWLGSVWVDKWWPRGALVGHMTWLVRAVHMDTVEGHEERERHCPSLGVGPPRAVEGLVGACCSGRAGPQARLRSGCGGGVGHGGLLEGGMDDG